MNAVMAGCRPEYMPVIIAALEGLTDKGFPLEFMQVTTNPMTPFLLINGPIRQQLDINVGTGCLGPGWRANATIGRAIRLILQNVGGACQASIPSRALPHHCAIVISVEKMRKKTPGLHSMSTADSTGMTAR